MFFLKCAADKDEFTVLIMLYYQSSQGSVPIAFFPPLHRKIFTAWSIFAFFLPCVFDTGMLRQLEVVETSEVSREDMMLSQLYNQINSTAQINVVNKIPQKMVGIEDGLYKPRQKYLCHHHSVMDLCAHL